ncbi:nucleoside-diphosphate sugar epimerase/dehydratase [Bellilinea sp.]|jgi:FlaA1/EpsC-like NDP-sugar epimerase|uniref:Polysaccharide biosynthesis protein n=1 Tax=Bellilinea caldifistulae TaxID=360411 RepID=A0A7C4L1S0_9CHLR|nr:nucleoside-diphosphate sugar epimerase/dehydratase [Bellilinea sp.]
MKNKPNIRNRYILIGDLALIVVSVIGALILRFELSSLFFAYLPFAYWMIAVALVVKPIVYYFFGLYRRMWMYASVEELKLIVIAVSTASVIVALVMLLLFTRGFLPGYLRSVLVIDWLLSLAMVGGLRFTFRFLAETRRRFGEMQAGRVKRVLIVGAGDAGALVVKELQKNPQLNLIPVGFLDDNPTKQKQQIHGVPVVGTINEMTRWLEKLRVDEVIIAIPSAPGRVVRMVADVARLKGIPFRTMPGIYELLGGRVSVSRLREVDITDLLRRQPTRIKEEWIGEVLADKVVLVTGAGGSIGRELCRQIARYNPAELIMLGHGENSIFEGLLELKDHFPSLMIRPVIADVRDRMRLNQVFSQFHPQIVFHAAAHKHVSLMEVNVEEAVTNNILGTKNLVELAIEHRVERLVMISSDKAVRPANVMGATKRIAEMLVIDAALRTGMAFSVVRFGNVLGSRGSVVPIFKQQIARGGPITITHPDMKRYFMTIPEAVYLVLQAAGMSKGAETFVLNMGQQVRILDLAEDLIRLSGLEPGKDIEIVFTGVRPGEKLSEDLWDEGFQFLATEHPDIFRSQNTEPLSSERLTQFVDELINLAREGSGEEIIQLMDQFIPGAVIQSTPPPEITSII